MGRPKKPLQERKFSITLTVPFWLYEYWQEHGTGKILDLLIRGLWADENGVDQAKINKLVNKIQELSK